MAAPGAMIAYALLGTSRTLVVSATTAASAVSAAAVGPLAGGDAARFAALSAALALVTAVVLAAAGALRLGAIADLVSKPVMTGFLFGLGLTIMVTPAARACSAWRAATVTSSSGCGRCSATSATCTAATLAVGAGSIAVLVAGSRLAPALPSMLLVLVLAIAASALLDLSAHGVDVVGDLPRALPDPAMPDVSAGDVVDLVGAGARRARAHRRGGRRGALAGHAARLHGRSATAIWSRSAAPTCSRACRRGSSSRAARARPPRPRGRAARPSSPR